MTGANGPARPSRERRRHGGAPISSCCQITTVGATSSSKVTSSSALWRQLAGTNTAPDLAQADEALDQPVAVLPEPEDDVAPADTGGEQGVGQPVGPVVELGVGAAVRAAHQGGLLWAAATVLAQHVAQRQVVQRVHRRARLGRAAQADGAGAAWPCSSGLTTLPVALRGSSSTKWHWRGTL